MTKRTIEIDLDIIAEEVSKVIAHKMGLEEKDEELSKKTNLVLLKSLKDEDFVNELTARYVDRANSMFDKLGKLIEELGVEIKND